MGEYEYNALHWRIVKRCDTSSSPNGLDQQRFMWYSSSWQLLQEDIDDYNTTTDPIGNTIERVPTLR